MSCMLRRLEVSRARGVDAVPDVLVFASTLVVVKFKLVWEFSVLGCFFHEFIDECYNMCC